MFLESGNPGLRAVSGRVFSCTSLKWEDIERVEGTAKGELLIRLLSCNDADNPLRRAESSSSNPLLLGPLSPHCCLGTTLVAHSNHNREEYRFPEGVRGGESQRRLCLGLGNAEAYSV